MIYDMVYDMIYIFSRNSVDTQWQHYSTHLPTNKKTRLLSSDVDRELCVRGTYIVCFHSFCLKMEASGCSEHWYMSDNLHEPDLGTQLSL
jgi:hypothetical protein